MGQTERGQAEQEMQNDSQEKADRIGSPKQTGQPEQDSQDRTTRIGHPEQDSRNRTARKRLL